MPLWELPIYYEPRGERLNVPLASLLLSFTGERAIVPRRFMGEFSARLAQWRRAPNPGVQEMLEKGMLEDQWHKVDWNKEKFELFWRNEKELKIREKKRRGITDYSHMNNAINIAYVTSIQSCDVIPDPVQYLNVPTQCSLFIIHSSIIHMFYNIYMFYNVSTKLLCP